MEKKNFPPSEIRPDEPPNIRNATSTMSTNQDFILILKELFIDRSSNDIYIGVFLREMCSDRGKTVVVDRKYRRALPLLCLTPQPSPNAAKSNDVLRFDSMLSHLRKLLYYDKHRYFSWENVFGPPQNHG